MEGLHTDDLGPLKVVHFHFPKTDFRAVLVIDNTALGPAIGGLRITPTVTAEEVGRLARAMTLKNSAAGLNHGGGKAGIVASPDNPHIERFIRLFARQIRELSDYIPGPDMGSNEQSMARIYDEIGRAVGLPEEIGGLPLDKLGATGFGIAECAEVACPYAGLELKGSRVAVEGFGSVGKAAAKFLSDKGAVIVAACDTKGTIYNPNGLDVKKLLESKAADGSVVHYKGGTVLGAEEIFALDTDILVPAASADVINQSNVDTIRAKLVIQGANIPATNVAEDTLHNKGILCIPDFIANAGGVIMGAMEYGRKIEREAFETIAARIKTNTEMVLKSSVERKFLPRQIAIEMAGKRIRNAMKYRDTL
ncbi:MAG: Glu/Leu/Phe/Val dehydrogenase [Candidatus Sulfobium sp.]|jgi:glutamate dehydrogenase (NAD(P)+)